MTLRRTTRRASSSGQRNVLLALGWYYPEIHRGVASFARDHGWHVTADFDDPIPKRWTGDGVLTLLGARQTLWQSLRRLRVPIVDLAESRPQLPVSRVTTDNAAVGRLAAEHFLNRGYRSFAFVHRWELGASRRRREAFVTAVTTAGQQCEIWSWQRERKHRPDTRQQRHRWLMSRLARSATPLAIFASRDVEAIEVIEACLSAGVKIPHDVAVLGADNDESMCDCLRVPLSSIDLNWKQIGYQGAALLERLMQGRAAPTRPVYVPPIGVVTRRSTESWAVDHPQTAAALRFIQEHAHLSVRMTDLAQHVHLSRSGLEKAFRRHYIRAPMEELRRVRLERAQKMLRETDDKIHTIAAATGLRTAHHLCRLFRTQLGLTPQAYRRQHLSG